MFAEKASWLNQHRFGPKRHLFLYGHGLLAASDLAMILLMCRLTVNWTSLDKERTDSEIAAATVKLAAGIT